MGKTCFRHAYGKYQRDSTPNKEGPPCNCSQPTALTMAWTEENPGRRFYKCDEHGFVVWHDKEKSCRWQKQSLLEARDKILTQAEEIKALTTALRRANAQIAALEVSRSSGSINESLKAIEDHISAHINETQKVVRNLVLYSGGGFAIASVIIIFYMKK
ncbi:hypothetical protein Bca52824_073750 [Brassica carinata]|uniref:DUF7900 domain-containing protein n=1 Tax=Brassica carinata TaxID=52824 RepID=A0A8X7U711_BRACI|nr:hypothetical protein Bca52824_073750 [Brassica carinata]